MNTKKRDKLTAAIISSNVKRQSINFEADDDSRRRKVDAPGNGEGQDLQISISAQKNPRDSVLPAPTPAIANRPANTYTQNQPMDHDGLSWPNTFLGC